LAIPDTDSDGAEDYIDLDADGDGLPDSTEGNDPPGALAGTDMDGDGLDDSCDPDNGGTPSNLPDLDCNGITDYLDAIISSGMAGDWNIGGTWAGGAVPGSGASVTVSHAVKLLSSRTVGNLTIDPSGDLDINGQTLTVIGNFVVTGTFIDSTGLVIFDGTCAQTICGGSILFNSLQISNTEGVSTTCGDIAVQDSICLDEGMFDINSANSFNLLSDEEGTSSIVMCGTGEMDGPITLERYKTGCVEGFFGIASPIDISFEDWNNGGLSLYGFTNAPLSFDTSNTYWYDETIDGVIDTGWVEPVDYFDMVQRGRGYYIYQGTSAFPLTVTTTANIEIDDFDFPLLQSNTSEPTADGYNFLGNPYPSAIKWDMTPGNGWVNVGCCDAVFTWDECDDQYESFAAGVGTNGGTGVIAHSQPFFVKAHLPGASLTVQPSAMVADPGSFKVEENIPNVLYLKMEDPDGNTDETAIRLHPNALEGMDILFDAGKLCAGALETDALTTPIVREIATMAGPVNGGMMMSINTFPDNGSDRTVPVVMRAATVDTYNLRVRGAESFPSDVCIVIEDLVTGIMLDAHTDTVYAFNMDDDLDFEHRFDVHISYPMESASQRPTCNSMQDGYAVAIHPGSGPFEYTWKDAEDNIVRQVSHTSNVDTLNNVGSGEFTVTVVDQGAAYCNTLSEMIVVPEPGNPINSGVQVTNTGCETQATGNVNIVVNGGTGPYNYIWSTGATTQDISEVGPGNYEVTITDSYGCSKEVSAVVTDGDAVFAQFSAVDTVNLYYGEYLSIGNLTTGALAYIWEFGDLSESSTLSTPTHYYDSVGVYEVSLHAFNGTCEDHASKMVVVVDDANGPVAVEESVSETDAVKVYEFNANLILEFDLNQPTDMALEVYNGLGQLIHSQNWNGVSQGREVLNLEDKAGGIYFAKIRYNEKEETKKLVIR